MTLSHEQEPIAFPRARWPWMTQAIGVYLGRTRVVAIERYGEEIAWILEGPGIEEFGDAGAAMTDLLARLPRTRGAARSPRLVVALPRECAQFKRLFAFPPVQDRATGSALVREGATRFFRRTAEDLITSALEQDDEGGPMAAAFEAHMVRAIREACARAGVRLHAVVPAGAIPERLECPPSVAGEEGRSAWHAASMLAFRGPIAFNALSELNPLDHDSPARMRLAVVVTAAALVVLLIAPLATARVVGARAAREHGILRSREASATAVSLELGRVSEALSEVGSSAAARRSVLELLAHITATLPAGAAITQLQLDSASGTLSALAPSADALVKELSRSPLLGAPAVVGPVTRERAGTREVDRLNVRFSHPPAIVREVRR